MLSEMSSRQIECRLDMVERMIAGERDCKNLPYLNRMFQDLLDEQVRRDLAAESERDNDKSD